MTRSDALRALIAKVEAGESWECPYFLPTTSIDAFHGSLDAAKALHEEVLPGWAWWFEPNQETHFAGVYSAPHLFLAGNGTPSRAWLIAILKALIAIEES